ncbi:hypothetical protein FOCG_16748 [Fusarium oxysporum f. sp. radicis-lycopersici 26381]|nr:hypothetical protein FOCG_16748 [Fusarium oxysporum f. sp. radicis-lycopersici 26381]
MIQHNKWMEASFFSLSPESDVRNASRAHYYTACTKMEFMLQLREELYVHSHKERSGTIHRGLEERPFRTACRTLEMSCSLREISAHYTWLFKTYTQWYALAYVLRYLSAFPSVPGAEEIWMLVNQTFSTIPYAQKLPSGKLAPESTGGNSIWKCLAWLRYQALNSKTTAQTQSTSVTRPLSPSPKTCQDHGGTHAGTSTTGLQKHDHDHGHDHGQHEHGDEPTHGSDAGSVQAVSDTCCINLAILSKNHHQHRHNAITTKQPGRNLGMLGVFIHILGDAFNNISIIITAVAIWKAEDHRRYYIDPAISIAPDRVELDDTKHDIESIICIDSVHELHVRQLDQRKATAIVHVVVDDETVAKVIMECLHAYGIHSITLQPEIRAIPLSRATEANSTAVDARGPAIELSNRQKVSGQDCQMTNDNP